MSKLGHHPPSLLPDGPSTPSWVPRSSRVYRDGWGGEIALAAAGSNSPWQFRLGFYLYSAANESASRFSSSAFGLPEYNSTR